jgi:hypothetical protein
MFLRRVRNMGTLKHRLKGGSVFRRELSETQEPYRIIFLSVEGKIESVWDVASIDETACASQE